MPVAVATSALEGQSAMTSETEEGRVMRPVVTMRNQSSQAERFHIEPVSICNLRGMEPPDISTKHGRLRKSRMDAGFKSIRAPAREFGWNESTYKGHELGIRDFGEEDAKRYARRFKKNWVWLLTGQGPEAGKGPLVDSFDPDTPEADSPPGAVPVPDGMVAIREVDIYAGAGGGGVAAYEENHEGILAPTGAASATVLFPETWLRDMGLDPAWTDLVRIRGASMLGVIDDGSWAFVDRRATVPSPPDIYLLWDGVGVICKYLEIVINSKPLMVRILSANEAFPADVQPLEHLRIIGRVAALIGKPQPMPPRRVQ